MNLKTRKKKMKSNIPAVFMALKDNETPIPAKIFTGITVAYANNMFDTIAVT